MEICGEGFNLCAMIVSCMTRAESLLGNEADDIEDKNCDINAFLRSIYYISYLEKVWRLPYQDNKKVNAGY